jgi:hypothetical protein
VGVSYFAKWRESTDIAVSSEFSPLEMVVRETNVESAAGHHVNAD